MMPHPPHHALRGYADDSLPAGRRGRVARHLLRCERCRRDVRAVAEIRAAAREATGPPLPDHLWSRIEARRATGERVILPSGDPPGTGRGGHPHRRARAAGVWLRRAAVLLLAVAGVDPATALPAVRGWLAPLLGAPETEPAAAPGPLPAADAADAVPAARAGIVLEPDGAYVRVAVEESAAGLRLSVRLTDRDEVAIRAYGAAADATFRSAAGEVGIRGAGPGEIEIDLPRGVRRIDLVAGGEILLAKDGERVRLLATPVDTLGGTLVFRLDR
jgi:hypothetical protein